MKESTSSFKRASWTLGICSIVVFGYFTNWQAAVALVGFIVSHILASHIKGENSEQDPNNK